MVSLAQLCKNRNRDIREPPCLPAIIRANITMADNSVSRAALTYRTEAMTDTTNAVQNDIVELKDVNGSILYSAEVNAYSYRPAGSISKECAAIAQALRDNASLRGLCMHNLDLVGASFAGADLREAEFFGCALTEADFGAAILHGAVFKECKLKSTNFSGAALQHAYIQNISMAKGANFFKAVLYDTTFEDTALERVSFYRAVLNETLFTNCELFSSTTFEDAIYLSAQFNRTDTSSIDLSNANLDTVKRDVISEILLLPFELETLRDTILDGKINGSVYSGECACLAGTLYSAYKKVSTDGGYFGTPFEIDVPGENRLLSFTPSSKSLRERFFLNINRGDNPSNNTFAAMALRWVEEAILMRQNILARASIPDPTAAPKATRISAIAADTAAFAENLTDVADAKLMLKFIVERLALMTAIISRAERAKKL